MDSEKTTEHKINIGLTEDKLGLTIKFDTPLVGLIMNQCQVQTLCDQLMKMSERMSVKFKRTRFSVGE